MTTTTTDTAQDLELEANVRQAYSDFRSVILAAMAELATWAGATALTAVLNVKDIASRNEAVRMKDEYSAMELVLSRFDSDWRHQGSLRKFVKAARGSIETNVDWYRREAGQYALKIVGEDPEDDTYAKGHASVVRAHQFSLVHERFLAKFDEMFRHLMSGIND